MNPLMAWVRALIVRARGRTSPSQLQGGYGGVRRLAINQSGTYVDETNALTLSAVWCAVRAISEPIAAMPYHVFMRSGKQRIPQPQHPIDWLLSMQPNPEQTAVDFWDCMMQWVLTWGNGYAEIERNARGEPVWLWPLEPWRVYARRNAAGGLEYVVTNQLTDATVIPASDMYHLHGLGDGLQGYSVVGMARESIGLGLTMEQFGAEFFGNGARMGAVIKAPLGTTLSEAGVDALKADFDARYGKRNRFKTGYLDNGMEVEFPSVPPEDAQFLQSRKFNVVEISRWFRVPPHLLYELDRATFTNIEHQSLEYVVHTLLPWAKKIERQTDVKLFGLKQRGVFYTKFNFDAMLRGDAKSRAEAYGIGRLWGWLSANDVRELEDMNPVKGGDEYFVQANLIAQDQMREKTEAEIEKLQAPPPAPAASAAPAQPDESTGTGSAGWRVVELSRRYAEASK